MQIQLNKRQDSIIRSVFPEGTWTLFTNNYLCIFIGPFNLQSNYINWKMKGVCIKKYIPKNSMVSHTYIKRIHMSKLENLFGFLHPHMKKDASCMGQAGRKWGEMTLNFNTDNTEVCLNVSDEILKENCNKLLTNITYENEHKGYYGSDTFINNILRYLHIPIHNIGWSTFLSTDPPPKVFYDESNKELIRINTDDINISKKKVIQNLYDMSKNIVGYQDYIENFEYIYKKIKFIKDQKITNQEVDNSLKYIHQYNKKYSHHSKSKYNARPSINNFTPVYVESKLDMFKNT